MNRTLAPTTSGSAGAALPGPHLPVVVQLGFAGSRFLVDTDEHPNIDVARFEAEVERKLVECLRELRGDLNLSDFHFLCGHSQIAIGADSLFTAACRDLHLPQRVLLPQPIDEFLAATSSSGKPDFTPAQRQAAQDLLASRHIIHQRVVSDAAERQCRFEDVNLEIVRISDVLVCLRRGHVAGKPGGTVDLIELAKRRQRPVLDIQVHLENGQPRLEKTWYHREAFRIPELPPEVTEFPLTTSATRVGQLPSVTEYCEPLRAFTSSQSKRQKGRFKLAALFIIGSHVLATVGAVIALIHHEAGFVPLLLAAELLLLVFGLYVHHHLHHSRSARVWALSRLVSEISRSVRAADAMHLYLNYLFDLPFPAGIRSLLRTLHVLHLRSTRAHVGTDWQPRRDRYLHDRFDNPEFGQLAFYGRALRRAAGGWTFARKMFYVCSTVAMAATLFKLLVISHVLPVGEHWEHVCTNCLGGLAIVMPVLAVAALSLAASFDLEALVHTYGETLEFLEQHRKWVESASSEQEFGKLLLATEACLLGETATWASRRSFKGVE